MFMTINSDGWVIYGVTRRVAVQAMVGSLHAENRDAYMHGFLSAAVAGGAVTGVPTHNPPLFHYVGP